jgi:cyclase
VKLDRREFSGTLALAAAAGLVRPRASFGFGQRATVFEWLPVNDGMRVATGGGGNVLAIADGGNTLLVDTKNPGYGKVLREEAEAFGGPLSAVINTHHHGDHSGGNPSFTADVAVYGQINGVPRAAASGEQTIGGIRQDPIGRLQRLQRAFTRPDVDLTSSARSAGSESMADLVAAAESLQPSDFSATDPFDDGAEVSVGSTAVIMRHTDNGHTDNDAFVWVPSANVMHAGDLFFNGLHPYIDVGAGATTEGWQRCIDAMVATADRDTVIIPGHGPMSDVGGLGSFRDYFDIMRAFVQKEIDAGRAREQITEMQPPEFQEWPGARRDQNLGIVYDELVAGQSGQ